MGSNLSDSEMTASGLVGPSLAAASLSRNWQPIETAPKDGTHILLSDGSDIVVVGEWYDRSGTPCWTVSWDGNEFDDASFWMPLPEPPTSSV